MAVVKEVEPAHPVELAVELADKHRPEVVRVRTAARAAERLSNNVELISREQRD